VGGLRKGNVVAEIKYSHIYVFVDGNTPDVVVFDDNLLTVIRPEA
jgi:hypothetical protein